MVQQTRVSDAMAQPKPPLRVLLRAHLALGTLTAIYGNAAYGGAIAMWPPHFVLKGVLIGIFLGQAVSAGLWTGLSNDAAGRRFGRGFIAAALIWALAITSIRGWTNGGAWIVFLIWFVIPWAAIALAASTLRGRGIRCLAIEGRSSELPPEGIQFSLRQLASMVALCAVLFGLVRGFKSTGGTLTLVNVITLLGAFAIIFSVQALACLWAALGAGDWIRRIWFPSFFALGWAPLLAFAFGGYPLHYAQFGVIALECVTLVIASLLVVRFAGYRLVRQEIDSRPNSHDRG